MIPKLPNRGEKQTKSENDNDRESRSIEEIAIKFVTAFSTITAAILLVASTAFGAFMFLRAMLETLNQG